MTMETYRHNRITFELCNDEVETIRDLVRLAYERLVNAPCVQMKGVPLQRQAGLVGTELFRAKQMLERLGKELGIDCPADAKPDNEEADCVHVVSGVISADSTEEFAAALAAIVRDLAATAQGAQQ
jgi:hypothetical protein